MITCEFENENKASLRHVTVVAIIKNKKREVLITRRADHLLRGGKFTIPGGFLDRDENTTEGVEREIKEETGLEVRDTRLFRINDNPNRPKEDRQNIDFIFLTEAKSEKFKQNNEVSEFKWVNERSLPSDEEFAFDHRDSIVRYFEYLKAPFELPIIG
jgi:8-oxo-dGTP diphosphatase